MNNKDEKHSDGSKEEETRNKEHIKDMHKDNAITEESGGPGEKYVKLSSKEVEELKKKASEYNILWDKYLRTCADFDNARKRWGRERKEIVKFANSSLIKDMLVILDELGHALRAIKEHSQDDKIAEGVKLTYDNLRVILEKEGVKEIEAKGKKFDPHIHEIVGQVENQDVEEHTVLEEIQKGYFLGDILLRTSKVVISVPKATGKEDDNQEGGDKDNNEEIKISGKEGDK